MIWLDCMQWSLHLSNGKIKIQLIIYLPSIFLIWESNGFKLIINLIPNDAQILRYPQNLSRISRGMFRHVQQYNNKVLIPNFLIFIYLFIYFFWDWLCIATTVTTKFLFFCVRRLSTARELGFAVNIVYGF